jgi:hypothetical protein
MKQTLIETSLFKPTGLILENNTSKRGNPMVSGILSTVEVKNGNGRYYSRELWIREIEKYADAIRERRAIGELDHPDAAIINLKNVSHNINKLWWEGDNIIGEIEILPTPSGNILKALVENKIMVGVSSRGMGSLKQIGETLEVQDDFELLCWDFVSTPSNPGSWMKLHEGKTNIINKYGDVNSIITDILCSNGNCPII